jgi:hypothetical protein
VQLEHAVGLEGGVEEVPEKDGLRSSDLAV